MNSTYFNNFQHPFPCSESGQGTQSRSWVDANQSSSWQKAEPFELSTSSISCISFSKRQGVSESVHGVGDIRNWKHSTESWIMFCSTGIIGPWCEIGGPGGHWWTLGCRAHLGRAQSPGSWRWNDTGACAQRPIESTLRREPAQYLGMQCGMRCGMAECNFSISFHQIKSSPNTKATFYTSEHIWAYVPCSKHGICGMVIHSITGILVRIQITINDHPPWHI